MEGTLDIAIEPLTAEAFAPFGEVIGTTGDASFEVAWARGARAAYDTGEPTALMVMDYRPVPLVADLVERHFRVTQAFIGLSPSPTVMVVAPPTARDAIPSPPDFRAFLMPGQAGVVLGRAVWHAVTRYPVAPEGARMALLTGTETQRELEAATKGGPPPVLTEMVSLAERFGTRLALTDPLGLLAAWRRG